MPSFSVRTSPNATGRFHRPLWIALALTLVVSCGESGEPEPQDLSTRDAADNFKPCGGDPTGTWTMTLLVYEGKDDCSKTRAEFEPKKSFLYFAEPHLENVPGSYVTTFGSDEPDGRVEKTVGDECLEGSSCEAHLADDDEPPICSEAKDACVCVFYVAPRADIAAAFWVTDKHTLKTTDSSGKTLNSATYCVSPEYLVIRSDGDENDVWTYVAER